MKKLKMWLILLMLVALLTGCSKVSEKVIQEDTTSSQSKKITNNTDSEHELNAISSASVVTKGD